MADYKIEIAPLGTPQNSDAWVDIVPYLAYQGLKWGRNDIDAANSGRDTQDGLMHRNRVAVKIRLDCTCPPLTFEDAHTVMQAIYPEYVLVRYKDLITGNTVTKTMYSNNIPATFMQQRADGTTYWGGIQFPLIER